MGFVDKLADAVDAWYKVTDPEQYKIRLTQRTASEHAFRYKQAVKSRIRNGFNLTRGSGDAHMSETDLKNLRNKSRAIDRDNFFATSILNRLEENVLGDALNVQVESNNKGWNDRAERLWSEWWNDSPEIRGMFAGGDLEKIVYRTKKVDGDVLVILRKDGKIQLAEADRIETPREFQESDNIINGVKVNNDGKILGYYITNAPDDKRNWKDKLTYSFVPADYAIFLAERHRFTMTRGLPVFTRNIDLFDNIDDFLEASIIQQKVSASHCVFIERKGGLDGLDGVTTEYNSEGTEQQQQTIEPGMILYGEPGENAKMLGASQTGQQFGPFMTQLLRFAGLIYGLPLEILSLDFSKTNYSSARASLLIAHKCFKKEHRQFVKQFIEPIARWKIRQWIREGKLSETRADYNISATPPKMISVDPLKETKADIERINAGLTTMRDVCASNGTDWRSIMKQREEEIINASKSASNVVKRTDEDWSARDMMGMSKSYNKEIFTEEADEPIPTDNPE